MHCLLHDAITASLRKDTRLVVGEGLRLKGTHLVVGEVSRPIEARNDLLLPAPFFYVFYGQIRGFITCCLERRRGSSLLSLSQLARDMFSIACHCSSRCLRYWSDFFLSNKPKCDPRAS